MTHFFIHIPKTAGTSYRKAFEKKYGSKSIVYDYGRKSPETHKLVLESYESDSVLSVDCLFEYNLIAGHIPFSKYSKFVGYSNCFTFLRDPIDRSYSDYQHVKRHYGYRHSLEEYLSNPQHRNRQCGFLKGALSEYLGFIGLTEYYKESLELIDCYSSEVSVEELRLNVNKKKSNDYDISDHERQLLVSANELDIQLYNRVKNEFNSQLTLAKETGLFCSGRIQKKTPNLVRGWVSASQDVSLEVEAILNDRVVAIAPVAEARPRLAELGVGFSEKLGFSIRSRQLDMSKVSVRIKGTEYYLSNAQNMNSGTLKPR